MKIIKFISPFLGLSLIFSISCTKKIQKTELAKINPSVEEMKLPLYRLGYGDIVEVRFFNNRQYNITVPVRPDGRISIEKIGDVFVDGKTPTYVDSVITSEFSKFLKDPEITVIVTEFGNNHFYVLGEVEAPGRYDIAKSMTAFQAIATAGGSKKDAKLSHVLLIRNADSPFPEVKNINLKNLRKNKIDPTHSLGLKPNDIVYVPNTRISDFAGFMTNVYSTVLPPIDSYLRAIFWSRL
ncbi:MAG: polysaccharide export protein [Calditrichaeota bacterium]|nr:MAG: polysaccharide export protein [Calditrichota bacterium]